MLEDAINTADVPLSRLTISLTTGCCGTHTKYRSKAAWTSARRMLLPGIVLLLPALTYLAAVAAAAADDVSVLL